MSPLNKTKKQHNFLAKKKMVHVKKKLLHFFSIKIVYVQVDKKKEKRKKRE